MGAAMLKLLFIDDDAFVLSAYRRMLHNSDYHCQFLQWPEQLWSLPLLSEVDIVLVDQMMPDIKGGDLLLALQQRYPAIKRVLMSGDIKIAQQQLPDALVVHALLTKPCSKLMLSRCIEELSRGLRQHDEK